MFNNNKNTSHFILLFCVVVFLLSDSSNTITGSKTLNVASSFSFILNTYYLLTNLFTQLFFFLSFRFQFLNNSLIKTTHLKHDVPLCWVRGYASRCSRSKHPLGEKTCKYYPRLEHDPRLDFQLGLQSGKSRTYKQIRTIPQHRPNHEDRWL